MFGGTVYSMGHQRVSHRWYAPASTC